MDAGLSLAEVAGTELTRQAVHLIETGKVRPTARSLRVIALRVGVSESSLLAPPGPMSDEFRISRLEQLCQRAEYALAAEQAERVLALQGSDELTAFAHHYAGVALFHLARLADALPHLVEARARFERLGNERWAAESMDWEAMALNQMESAAAALRVGRRALRRYRAQDSRSAETEARILEHLGTISAGRHDYEAGRGFYEAALQVDGGVRELARIARVYHGLATCYQGMRQLSRANELMLRAIALYEAEQRIAPAPMRLELPVVENDYGMVLMDLGDLERAEEVFRAAFEHFAEAGIERLQSHALLSLGELRQRQGLLDDALELVAEALSRAASLDETYALGAGYRQLGELHELRGEREHADASFQRALALCQQAGLVEREAECLHAYERVLAERRHARRRSRSAGA